MTMGTHKLNITLTKDTSYLALTGELWGVCCEHFGENQPYFNGIAPYFFNWNISSHSIFQYNAGSYIPHSVQHSTLFHPSHWQPCRCRSLYLIDAGLKQTPEENMKIHTRGKHENTQEEKSKTYTRGKNCIQWAIHIHFEIHHFGKEFKYPRNMENKILPINHLTFVVLH